MPFKFALTELPHTDDSIETGTFKGGFTRKLSCFYNVVHTIDISEIYLNRSKESLKDCDGIKFYLGDTVDILPTLVSDKRMTIFLDAHYQNAPDQGPDTRHHPLLEEIDILSKCGINDHTIVIDDVRLFRLYGTSKEDVEQRLLSINKDYTFEYKLGRFEEDVLVAYIK